jgi:RNA-directed DNA polymerase
VEPRGLAKDILIVREMESRLRNATTGNQITELSETFKVNSRGLSEKLFILRQKLYLKAKAEPKYRFYTLYDRIFRWDVLVSAWKQVSRNAGSSGVDRVSIKDIQTQPGGVEDFLMGIRSSLKAREYKPAAVRRCYILKANGKERPLGIPTIRDRVVQTAVFLVIEPIFEADFLDVSYGFRPKRSAHNALGEVRKAVKGGRTALYDVDMASFFDTIPHDKLMKCIHARITDGSILKLIRQWLNAPFIERVNPEKGKAKTICRRSKKGTPQGGIISPLLANCYLHWLDKLFMSKHGPAGWANAKMYRYADDFVILAKFIGRDIVEWIHKLLEDRMSLEINREKTEILRLAPKRDNLNFLGYCLSYRKSKYKGNEYYLAMLPSKKAVQSLKNKIRDLTRRRRGGIPIPQMVREVNSVLRGWNNYFSKGHKGKIFNKINHFVYDRFVIHLMGRSQCSMKPTHGMSWYEFIYRRLGVMQI